jgi:YfiH family protein
VARNIQLVCAELGFSPDQLARVHQVHGSEIKQVSEPGCWSGYDALVTDASGILLGVSIADCTPVLIADPRTGCIAAIHAGWRGTALGVVGETLALMVRQFGVDPVDCRAYVGTCIDVCSFEVGDEVADIFPGHLKIRHQEGGKYHVDLKKAQVDQLVSGGMCLQHIELSNRCTVQHGRDYFSYRRACGKTGRMMALIGRHF